MNIDPIPGQAERITSAEEVRALRARIAELEAVERRDQALHMSTAVPDSDTQSLHRLQFVINQITEAYFSLDSQWRFVALNSVAEQKIFQRPAEMLIGRVFWEEFPQATSTEFYRQYHLAMQHGQPVHFEAQSAITYNWYEVHAYPNGEFLDIFLRDITTRKQIFADLERSQEQYRQLAESAQIDLYKLEAVFASMVEGLIIVDPDGGILTMNHAAQKLYLNGQSCGVQKLHDLFNCFECTYPDGSPCPYEEWPLIRAAGGEKVVAQELITIAKDSGKRWTGLFNATPVFDAQGEIMLIVTTVLDMTDQRKLADEMQLSVIQIELQRMIMQDRENERVKIAQDLHDGPLQHIMGLEYDLTEALGIDSKAARIAMLNRLRNNLLGAAQVLRAFCSDLRPPSLAVFGLEKAIRSHVDQLGNSHPELHFRMELMEDGLTLSVETRMILFRIYQELMTNIIRHAEADQVNIVLTLDEAQAELEIQDNGRGFQPPSHWIELAQRDHFGLVGVQERASAIGGRVVLRSQPGQGTLIRVLIPLDSPPENETDSKE